MKFSEDAVLQAAATLAAAKIARGNTPLNGAEMGNLLVQAYETVRAVELIVERTGSPGSSAATSERRSNLAGEILSL